MENITFICSHIVDIDRKQKKANLGCFSFDRRGQIVGKVLATTSLSPQHVP